MLKKMKLMYVVLLVVLILVPLFALAQRSADNVDDSTGDVQNANDDQQQYDNTEYGDSGDDQNTSPSTSSGDENDEPNQDDAEDGLTTDQSTTDGYSSDTEQADDSSVGGQQQQTTQSSSFGRRNSNNNNKNNNKNKSKSQTSGSRKNSKPKQEDDSDSTQNDDDDQATSTSNPNDNDEDYQPPTNSVRRGSGKNQKGQKNFDFSSGSQFNGEGGLDDGDDNDDDQQDGEDDQNDDQQKSSSRGKNSKNNSKNDKSRNGKNSRGGKQQQQQGKSKSGRQQQQQSGNSSSGSGGGSNKKQQRERQIYANFTEQSDFSGMEGSGGMGVGGKMQQLQTIEPINVDYFPKYQFHLHTVTLPFEVTVTKVNTINVVQTRPVMLLETSLIASTISMNLMVHTSAETVSTITVNAPLTAGATRFRTIVQPTTTVVRSSSVVTSTVQDTPYTVYITASGEPYCYFADVRPTVIIRTQLITEATQHYLTQTLTNTQLSSPQERFPVVNATVNATITLTKTRFAIHAKTEHRNVTITSMTPVIKRNVTTLQAPITTTIFTTTTNTIARTISVTEYTLPPNIAQQKGLDTDIVLTTITPTFTRVEPILRTKFVTNQVTIYSSVYEPNHECQRVANFNVTHTVLAVTTTTSRVTLYQYQVATYAFNEFDGKFNASQAAAARNATMQARMAQQQQQQYYFGSGGRRGQRGGINATRTFAGNNNIRFNNNNNGTAMQFNQTAPTASG